MTELNVDIQDTPKAHVDNQGVVLSVIGSGKSPCNIKKCTRLRRFGLKARWQCRKAAPYLQRGRPIMSRT